MVYARRQLLLGFLCLACGGDDMAGVIIPRQVTANPISAPSIATPASLATLEVAVSCLISGSCDALCTRVDILLENGSLLGSVIPSAGAYQFYWSPGQKRVGTRTLVIRTYIGGSYAQVSRNIVVSPVPIPGAWDIGYWHADALASTLSEDALVTSWPAWAGSQPWTAANDVAPVYKTSSGGNGWPGAGPGAGKGCILFDLGKYMLNNSLVSAFTGANARTVFIIYQQQTGAGTQTLLCASALSGSANKWQLFSNSAPGAYRVLRGSTQSVFGTIASQRNDLGCHFVCVRDSGTGNIELNRDTLWVPAVQSVANAAVTANTSTQLALCANFNGTSTPTNLGNIKLLCVGLSTQALTSAQIQKAAYQALGLYDNDQYYGNSATNWKLNPYVGQSNTQGLAVSNLTALPLIRFMAISTNNWIADMSVPVSTGPQGSGPYIGPWYQCAQDRKTITGQDVHSCMLGQGATGINTFKDPSYDGLYSTALFDMTCRVIAETKAAIGGTPDIDRLFMVEGESDSQSGAGSSTYQANMTTWAANMRSLVPGISAATRIVAPQVSSFSAYPFGAAVQAAQQAWAAADVNGAAPSVAPLASAGFFNPDNIHYNQAGQLGLGSIMAAA